MAKLNKTQREEIAQLINTAMVSSEMANKARSEGNREKQNRWCKNEAEATIALADRFGIELPTLEFFQSFYGEAA